MLLQVFLFDDNSWAKVMDSIYGTPSDVIVIANSINTFRIDTAHCDGIYT
jgi:hypothetical protein